MTDIIIPGERIQANTTNSILTRNRVKDLTNIGVKFKEHFIDLGSMRAILPPMKANESSGSTRNLLRTEIEFGSRKLVTSQRFWTSFCAKVGVGTNVFNLFNHAEVFNRVIEKKKFSADTVRVVEDVKNGKLLAITDPTKTIINWENLVNLIDQKDGYQVAYNDGMLSSVHSLANDLDVKVGSEDYRQRIYVETPVDGYGSPSIYLALLRLVCSNGAVAMSKAFKTTINVNKKEDSDEIEYAMERMFDSYSNDEGFDALIRRMQSARRSKLSLREFHSAQKVLSKIPVRTKDPTVEHQISEELKRFSSLAGNLHAKYGLSSLQQMTEKQMALLETDLTVYEAINFLTEISTHRLDPRISRDTGIANQVHGWVGSMVARPYDLENAVSLEDAQEQFQDLYFKADPKTVTVNSN